MAARGLVNGGTTSGAQWWDGAKRKFCESIPPAKQMNEKNKWETDKKMLLGGGDDELIRSDVF